MVSGSGDARQGEADGGLDIVAEATALMRRMEFSPDRGSHGDGTGVMVDIIPDWDEGRATFSATLSCHAYGHRSVAWQGTPLFLAREPKGRRPSPSTSAVALLDRRGQCTFSRLVPATYRVITSEVWGHSGSPVPQRLPAPWFRDYESNDERVRLTVAQDEDGRFKIGAETRDVRLREAVVLYCFLDRQSGRLGNSGQLHLEPVDDLFVGVWTEEAERALAAKDAADLELVFCVVPAPDELRESRGAH